MTARRRLVSTVVVVFAVACSSAVAAPVTVSSSDLTTFRSCTLAAISPLSGVATDATVDQNSPGSTLGLATSLTLTSRSSRNTRVYLRFDLSSCDPVIPATASIDRALLRVAPSAVASACRTYDIFRVTSSWMETAIRWNNQPFGTTLNDPPTASRTASSNIGAAPCANTQINVPTSGWDVTADVRLFHTGTSNFGWMIRDDVENSGTTRTTTLYAREQGSVASPQLIVTYRP